MSGNIEYAPITGSLIGVRGKSIPHPRKVLHFIIGTGSETALLEVAQAAIDKEGWPSKVLTGRTTFHVGNNSRNSAVEPGAKL